MKPDEVFHLSNKIIRRIINLLNNLSTELHKKGLPPQRISDLQQGLVYNGKVYVPLSSIEHRILLAGYKTIFLDTFISLFQNIYKNRTRLLTQFSLRTLAEMGFPRCQILFSKVLSKEEIERYKLLIMLSDYGFIALNNQNNMDTFDKLLEEDGDLLSEKQKETMNLLINSAKESNTELHKVFTKRARKIIDSTQDQLFRKTPILPIFRAGNIEALFSGFSHILHGNILLISDILTNKRPNQHKLRVYWFLLLTGINMTNHIALFLEDSRIQKKVEKFNKDFDEVALIVKNYWSTI